MTLILSESDFDELHQQAPQPQVQNLVLDSFERLEGLPEILGGGYNRSMKLSPGVWLNFSDCEYNQDLMVKTLVHEHPIQFTIFLSGLLYFDNVHPNLGGTHSYFSGSGISPGYIEKYRAGERLTLVNVEIEPELLDSFLLEDGQYNSDIENLLFKGEDWKTSFYPTVTPAMRSLAQQMWNPPYRGTAKRMYLQAKVFELVAMHLDLIASDQQPIYELPGFKPDTGAFSPRIGLVYQPSDTISLYTSYSQSFRAQTGFSSSTQGFDPTRGTQYEVGIKADWLEGKLSTTLAAYHLTKTNVLTTDPSNPQFSIQTGEQRSQGIELDIAGEILPGWKVIASYAYTDAQVTKDNSFPVGNRLNNVPINQASLWTTYEIQQGNLQGLGFGLGLFYVGERQGDLANSFQLKDYLRTDAALYYRRDRFRTALNVRNLFDIDYASSASSRNFIYRGEPFTVVGSISWEF